MSVDRAGRRALHDPTRFRPRILTLCYVIPDYLHPDDKLPGTADEAAYLKRVFRASAVEPHALPLRRVLRGPGDFDLLHFAGHGVAEQEDIVNTVTRVARLVI